MNTLKISKEKIKEKLEAIDHFLYFFYPQNKDYLVLKSTIEDLVKLFKQIVDLKLFELKEKGKINLIPKEFMNKSSLFYENYKEKMNKKDVEIYNILLLIIEDRIYLKKYSNFEDAENFYKFIRKIFDF